MVIKILHNTFEDPDKSFLFRQGSLWALKSLIRAKHELISDTQFSSEQEVLLKQEEIHWSESSAPDLIISSEGKAITIGIEGNTLFESESWAEIVNYIQYPPRRSVKIRKTKETDIRIEVNLDGTGESEISTGLNFFDHMLEQIARHGLIDLKIDCKGDLEIDEHHTIEDVAITLGEAISEAFGEKLGIERYGFVLAMDESKAIIGLDLSGRPYLVFNGSFAREYVGDMPTEMVKHFFHSLAMHLKATLNIEIEGDNEHHKIEACFKGFAKALKSALEKNPRRLNQLPSSKGLL